MRIEDYINDQPVNPPANNEEFVIQLNFDSNDRVFEFSSQGQDAIKETQNSLRFVFDAAKLIHQWIKDGYIMEGIPYKRVITHGSRQYELDMYIDLTDRAEFACKEIKATAKLKQSRDWLNDVADGFTFEYLFEHGYEAQFRDKFVYEPYCISKSNGERNLEMFTSLMGAFMVGYQLFKAIDSLTNRVINMIGLDAVQDIISIISLIIEIIFVIGLMFAALSFFLDFVLSIVQPVKFLCGMRYADMLSIGCSYLGLRLNSSVYQSGDWKDMVWIPEKTDPVDSGGNASTISNLAGWLVDIEKFVSGIAGSSSGIVEIILNIATNPLHSFLASIDKAANSFIGAKVHGYLAPNAAQRGYFNGTFGEFLRIAKLLCNGKIIIKDGELILEPYGYNLSSPKYQLPDVRVDWWEYNTDEFKSNIILAFQSDLNDKNTIEQYKGTSVQITQYEKVPRNPDLFMGKGLERITFPCALGKRKTELTGPEKILKLVAKIVNGMVDVLTNIIDAIIDVINFVVDLINEILEFIRTVINFIINIVIDAINLIVDAIFAIINGVIDLINDVIPGDGPLSHIDAPHIPRIELSLDNIKVILGALSIIGATFPLLVLDLVSFIPHIDHITPPRIPSPEDRIGMLIMENDLLNIPKSIIVIEDKGTPRNTKLHPDNARLLSAKYIFDNFYSQITFVETNGRHNQWVRRKMKAPFCFDDFELVKEDNRALDDIPTEITSIKWNVKKGGADIIYKTNELYTLLPDGTNNIQLQITEPDGQ